MEAKQDQISGIYESSVHQYLIEYYDEFGVKYTESGIEAASTDEAQFIFKKMNPKSYIWKVTRV